MTEIAQSDREAFYLISIYLFIFSDLHIAIVNQTPRIVSAIIQLTPDSNYLNIKNDHVQAPIHLAAITQQSHIVRHLLIAGASVCVI